MKSTSKTADFEVEMIADEDSWLQERNGFKVQIALKDNWLRIKSASNMD